MPKAKTEGIIGQTPKKRLDALEHITKELVFINNWLNSDPGGMKKYLGRRSGLREIISILE